jgi:hypothetical protein
MTSLWDYALPVLDRFDAAVVHLHAIHIPALDDLPKFVSHKTFWPDAEHAWNALLPAEGQQVLNTRADVIATADQFGIAVEATTHVAQDRQVAAQVLRDCTRNALDTTAYDLWWASTGNSFDLNSEVKQAITGCLAVYTEAAPQLSDRVASVVAAQIATGVLAVETVQNDYATVSNWTRALQGYLPA